MGKPPRSKLAVAFYVFGTVLLLSALYPVFFISMLGIASGGTPKIMGGAGAASMVFLAQPIMLILLGGVAQILSDIRWALLNDRGDRHA
jgi:hypothetical protein